MTTPPPVGTPLEHALAYPRASVNTLDPRNAMARVLAAYLSCLEFRRSDGRGGSDRFTLERVSEEWPDPSQELIEPTATVLDRGEVPYQEHHLTPTPCEDTLDLYCPGTVMWKTAEAVSTFSVDVWTPDLPTREAILAAVPAAFCPSEVRAGVLLQGDPEYFGLAVRATLLNHRRIDAEAAVYENERRAQLEVRCEIPVVHLRTVKVIEPRTQLDVT